jgi:hypothetical protein
MKGVVLMSVMFKKTFMLNEEDKKKLSEMSGKILIWAMEGRHTAYMAEQLNMSPHHVSHNIYETLYVLKKYVGWRRYLRVLFWK